MRAGPASFDSSQTEIANLHSEVIVQENIVALQVSVNDILSV